MTITRTGNRQLMQEVNMHLMLQVIRQQQPISQVDILRGPRRAKKNLSDFADRSRWLVRLPFRPHGNHG